MRGRVTPSDKHHDACPCRPRGKPTAAGTGAHVSNCTPSGAHRAVVLAVPSARRGSISYSSRTTMAKDVQIRRKPLCPLRPVWLMHSTSTAAPSVDGVAAHLQ